MNREDWKKSIEMSKDFYKKGRLHGILFSSLFWITAIIVFSYVTTTYAVNMTASVPKNPCNRCLQYCQ